MKKFRIIDKDDKLVVHTNDKESIVCFFKKWTIPAVSDRMWDILAD